MDHERLNTIRKNTLMEQLDIVFTASGDDWIEATMPVDHRTCQPFGYLHGGASLALAETVASSGSFLLCESSGLQVFGSQVSGNHLKTVKEGRVTALGNLIHSGKQTHVWDVKITDSSGRIISLCRVVNRIVEKR